VENPCVRFDDLSPGGSGSFGLVGLTDTLVARRVEDVTQVLDAVEKAAAAGYWVAGFVGYEAAPAFNPMLTVRPPDLHAPLRDLPLAHFQVFSTRVELDEVDSLVFPAGAYNVSGWSPDATRQDYSESLATTGRAIMAGEISRGKYTFRLRAAFSGDPAALYKDLLLAQRGPYAACIDTGRFRLVSASPERFFRRTGSTLTVSPVLASIRRGRWLEEDEQLAAVLSAEAETSYANRTLMKEIEAELAELGDLVAVPLQDRLRVERMEILWHLTARVGVHLRDDIRLADIFAALFPSVAVTGVPKPEAMELIAATEDTARGAYCGAIGFVAPESEGSEGATFSVAVRTVVIDQDEGVAEYGVGTAITNTSDVIGGYEEARLKARILVERRPEFRIAEDFRVENGVVRAMQVKIDSMLASARYFGFSADRGSLGAVLRRAASGDKSMLLRIMLDRGGVIKTEETPAPDWFETPDGAPQVEAAIAAQPVSAENAFLFHHTTSTRLSELFRRQYPTASEVVLINEQDEVAGTLAGNVAVMIDGRWATPPRGCGTTAGAFRQRLIDAHQLDVRVISSEQLLASDAVAAIDDVFGWRLLDLKD